MFENYLMGQSAAKPRKGESSETNAHIKKFTKCVTSMKTKKNKDSRNLLIALLLGDGSISAINNFRLAHCIQQRSYLDWKVKQLRDAGIKCADVKIYISSNGYNVGKEVVYTRLQTTKFTKVLRRVLYRPKKDIANRKLLNRIDARGLAIWYMDDGCINHRTTKGKVHGFYVRMSTCLPKDKCQVLIDYFREVWNINFYTFSEGRGTYSLCCGTKEAIKFIDIVKPYVSQVPEMLYKVTYDLSQRTRVLCVDESRNTELPEKVEDIVQSPQ